MTNGHLVGAGDQRSIRQWDVGDLANARGMWAFHASVFGWEQGMSAFIGCVMFRLGTERVSSYLETPRLTTSAYPILKR